MLRNAHACEGTTCGMDSEGVAEPGSINTAGGSGRRAVIMWIVILYW